MIALQQGGAKRVGAAPYMLATKEYVLPWVMAGLPPRSRCPNRETIPMKHTNSSPRIALFGAAPDSSNMGVSALFASTVAAIYRLEPDASFAVFDNGLGVRKSEVSVGDGRATEVDRYGARSGMRFDRPENLVNMSVTSWLGPIGGIANRGVREIDRCSMILDVSGGDSFSDIYGRKRFLSVARPKLIALRRGVPLILLPQTYGPYEDQGMRKTASRIVRGAEMCWARDARVPQNPH